MVNSGLALMHDNRMPTTPKMEQSCIMRFEGDIWQLGVILPVMKI